jgi:hypothetical protein
MMVGAALFWAATTLTIKASPLTRASAEKVMLYHDPAHKTLSDVRVFSASNVKKLHVYWSF